MGPSIIQAPGRGGHPSRCHLALGVFGWAVLGSASGQCRPHPCSSGPKLLPSALATSQLLSSLPTEQGQDTNSGKRPNRGCQYQFQMKSELRPAPLPCLEQGSAGAYCPLTPKPMPGWSPFISSKTMEGVLWVSQWPLEPAHKHLVTSVIDNHTSQ